MKIRFSAAFAAGLAVVLLAASPWSAASAAGGPPDRVDVKGKKFVRVDGKWYLETPAARRFEVMPDVVTVKFKKDVPEAAKGNLLRAKNARKLRVNRLGVVDISVPPGMDALTFVQQLQKEGNVEYAEVNTYGKY